MSGTLKTDWQAADCIRNLRECDDARGLTICCEESQTGFRLRGIGRDRVEKHYDFYN